MSGVHSHWGRRHQLFVITVREPKGRLVALAPFCIRRPLVAAGLRAVRFLSAPSLAADHMTLLVEPEHQEEALAEIARFMIANRDRWDYIELADADAGSPPLLELQRQLCDLGMGVSNEKRYICPYAVLPSDFEQYLATIGPSVRYNFRRRLRNLKRQYPVQFIAIDRGPELASGFDTMVNLHSLRFQQRGTSSAFTTAKALAFHRSVLHRLAERGWVRLFLLCTGNAVVAALYGFSIGRGFKFYQCGMHPGWSNFSVGLVLMGCTIEAAIQSGHQQYDFLRGDERYKFHWAKHYRETIVLRFYDSRLRSRLAAKAIALRTRLGRLWNAWNRAIRGLGSLKPAQPKDQCA
jgi:CelD/BcsL family acetyltransferase involved in cellulose biosynthesis